MKQQVQLLTVVCSVLIHSVNAQDPPRLVSPEVRPDRTIVFRFWAPRAAEVLLAGNWMVGQPLAPLKRGEDGVWTATLGPLEPNIYAYAFLVDGIRTIDPSCRCAFTWANRGADSRFVVPGDPPRPWEPQNTPTGTLHHEQFFSKRLQAMRRFLVYTPPGYQESGSRQYPMLMFFSGTPGDEFSWTSGGGHADAIFDNLIAEDRMTPMIVVLHASDVLDPPDERRGDENLRAFETVVVSELVPAVRDRYRVSKDPQAVAIAGQSLGGEFGMYVGLNHPELFRTIGSLSGSFVGNSIEGRFGPALADADRVRRTFRLIWIDCGTEDIFFSGNKALASRLASTNIPHTFRPSPGPHTMQVARQALVDFLQLLFRSK